MSLIALGVIAQYATILVAIIMKIPDIFAVINSPPVKVTPIAKKTRSTRFSMIHDTTTSPNSPTTTMHNANSDHMNTISLSALYLEFFYYLSLLVYEYFTIQSTPFFQSSLSLLYLNIPIYTTELILLLTTFFTILLYCYKNSALLRQKPKILSTFILALCLSFFVYNRLFTKNENKQFIPNYDIFEYLVILPTFLQLYKHCTTISLQFIHKAVHSRILLSSALIQTTYYLLKATSLVCLKPDSSNSPLDNTDLDYHAKLIIFHTVLLAFFYLILSLQSFFFPYQQTDPDTIIHHKNDEKIHAIKQEAIRGFQKLINKKNDAVDHLDESIVH